MRACARMTRQCRVHLVCRQGLWTSLRLCNLRTEKQRTLVVLCPFILVTGTLSYFTSVLYESLFVVDRFIFFDIASVFLRRFSQLWTNKNKICFSLVSFPLILPPLFELTLITPAVESAGTSFRLASSNLLQETAMDNFFLFKVD